MFLPFQTIAKMTMPLSRVQGGERAVNEITTINPTGVAVQDAETMPHSIEAEQQLLGAVLTNNGIYDRVASIITPLHFFCLLYTSDAADE